MLCIYYCIHSKDIISADFAVAYCPHNFRPQKLSGLALCFTVNKLGENDRKQSFENRSAKIHLK